VRKLLLLLVACVGLSTVNGASAQTVVPINVDLQNTNNTVVVIGFCNATSASKDLEGWVGQTSAATLVASHSGISRQTITIIVPPLWRYKIKVALPPNGVCTATIWAL
jgi:hypothetical protein